MSRVRWTPEQRDEAIAAYEQHGPREAARRTGVPAATITDWAKANGHRTYGTEQTRAATERLHADGEASRAQLAIKMLARAHDMLARMDARDAGAVRNYAVTLAILIDKLRLEEGAVTSRHEEVTADERRRRIAERLDDLEVRRQGRRAS